MKLTLLTIVLDGMPWIASHWPELKKLDFDWQWLVAEGVSAPVGCTSWCAQQAPRLSEDGTTGYLDTLASYEPRVKVFRKELWQGKVAMLNFALKRESEPCLLVQADSDELWTAEQLAQLRELFLKHPKKNAAYFWCDYRLGPGVRITSRDTYGNQSSYEWLRAWRWEPWMSFKSHEPPVMAGADGKPIAINAFTHAETAKHGLIFRHEAWSTREQVARKAAFYGSAANKEHGQHYKDAVAGWERLQRNRKWPVKVKEFLPWVDEKCEAEKVQGP